MSETGYWEERERAKKAALKMAANLSARDKGLAVSAATKGLIDDVRRDQTYQRAFERSFLSLDHPDEDGNVSGTPCTSFGTIPSSRRPSVRYAATE